MSASQYFLCNCMLRPRFPWRQIAGNVQVLHTLPLSVAELTYQIYMRSRFEPWTIANHADTYTLNNIYLLFRAMEL